MGPAKSKPQTGKQINVRWTAEEVASLEEFAHQEGRTVAASIRYLVRTAIRREREEMESRAKERVRLRKVARKIIDDDEGNHNDERKAG